MKIVYTLTPQLRIKLKEPFGTLIEGTPEQNMIQLKELLAKKNPPRLISVGDVVSRNLHQYGMHPQLTVIDNISLRDQVMPKEGPVEKTVNVKNPPAVITQEAMDAIKLALESNQHTHVVVDGEEDLLLLTAVLYAPKNAFVVYGQPHLGIVVVEASAVKKAQTKGYLKEMKASKS
jgi:GTP-dependent dephospho-CoA kinase